LTQKKRLKSGKIRIIGDVRKKIERGRRAIAATIARLSPGSFRRYLSKIGRTTSEA
jgi:hypothetical protein